MTTKTRRPRGPLRSRPLMLTALGVAGIAMVSSSLSASAASSPITEYDLPTPVSGPCEIEFDRNGKLWLELISANALGRLDTETGEVEEFPLPTPGAIPGGMELGPDGAMWLPEVVGNEILRVDPSDGSMERYPIPDGRLGGDVPLGLGVSDDLSAGKDGAMWFTLNGSSAIGRIDVKTKEITSYPLPTQPAGPIIIQPGPGNRMVFPEAAAGKVGTIDVFTKEIVEYELPTPASVPQGVTLGPDGAIWFTETAGQNLGRIDVETGEVREFSIAQLRESGALSLGPGNPLPFPGPIRTGSDGNLYFVEGNFFLGNKIARFNPRTKEKEKELVEYTTPTPLSGPCDLNNQHPGEIWFGEFSGNKIGRLTIGK